MINKYSFFGPKLSLTSTGRKRTGVQISNVGKYTGRNLHHATPVKLWGSVGREVLKNTERMLYGRAR